MEIGVVDGEVATEASTAFPTEETGFTPGELTESSDASAEQIPTAHATQPVGVTEFPTEDATPTPAAPTEGSLPPPRDGASSGGGGGGGGSWMAGLASSMGFGLDISSSGREETEGEVESEEDPEVVVVVPEIPATTAVVVSAAATATGDGGSVVAVATPAVEAAAPSGPNAQAEASSSLAPVATASVAAATVGVAVGEEEGSAKLPADKEEGGGLSGSILQRRKESIAAEMKAFLEDSDEEAFGADKDVGTAVVDGSGATDSAAASANNSAVEMPSSEATTGGVAAAPRTPREDTEFSAQHAKKVIGSGVVLERKASISGSTGPAELKNKSKFSVEDATATISAGAISERTRKLQEEQEALRLKHATERQDTDLLAISAEMSRQGSVKDKSHMYNQALGGSSEKQARPAGRLNGDWTQRRESLEQFVVKYEPPENPSVAVATGTADAPTRYIPLPTDNNSAKMRGGSGQMSSHAPEPEGVNGEVAAAAAGMGGASEDGGTTKLEERKETMERMKEGGVTGEVGEAGGGETRTTAGDVGMVQDDIAEGDESVAAAAAAAAGTTTAKVSNEQVEEGGAEGAASPVGKTSVALSAAAEKKALGNTGGTDVASTAGDARGEGSSAAAAATSPDPKSITSSGGGCCTIS